MRTRVCLRGREERTCDEKGRDGRRLGGTARSPLLGFPALAATTPVLSALFFAFMSSVTCRRVATARVEPRAQETSSAACVFSGDETNRTTTRATAHPPRLPQPAGDGVPPVDLAEQRLHAPGARRLVPQPVGRRPLVADEGPGPARRHGRRRRRRAPARRGRRRLGCAP